MRNTTTALILCLCYSASAPGSEFTSRWDDSVTRVWAGSEYWANRLQDWRIRDGELECVAGASRLSMRTVHLLTHRLSDGRGDFDVSVRVRHVPDNTETPSDAATGFLIGVGGAQMDYRAAAIVHCWPGMGAGVLAGLDGEGHVFFRDNENTGQQQSPLDARSQAATDQREVILRLSARANQPGQYKLALEAVDSQSENVLCRVSTQVSADRLIGNVALVSHPGKGGARFGFRDWQLGGDKLAAFPQATLGPIVCTQHTLSRGVLKMTAQLMPIGVSDPDDVTLQIQDADGWKSVARADVVRPGFTATFRVSDWDTTHDVPYRVVYALRVKPRWTPGWVWSGTIRKDPIDKNEIVVAGFTGNHNNAHGMTVNGQRNWPLSMWFPHADLTAHVVKHDPHVLFFSGDQVYEGASPTFADTSNIQLDYLYKWYLWCWAYRDLCRDIPCICIPDDHDVYQGNLWGQAGRKSPGRDHDGGYVHPAEFVKMVERTQTSHLPDPFDPTPLEQGLGVYYTDMTYGRISIAMIEDRKFKSGCARPDMPPNKTNRPDHFNDPGFDTQKLDVKGVQLLGDRQLKFLDAWAKDWRGADMKMAVSQTTFANMATHHGGGLARLITDLDSNGWPQSGRNRALRALRKGFAFHLSGDQHLATIVHQGIDQHGDAAWAFCVPSIANFYPRAYAPENVGKYERPTPDQFTGPRRDGLGNLVTVYAATNPGKPAGHEPRRLHDGMPGYGIVRLNKDQRTITMQCWPRFADPDNPQHSQYEGWPKTVSQRDNYARKAFGYLPTMEVQGVTNPVVQVIDENSGETIYTLRISGTRFQPQVFADGAYTVHVGQHEPRNMKTLTGLRPAREQTQVVRVRLGDN